jgi:hypothetical protein
MGKPWENLGISWIIMGKPWEKDDLYGKIHHFWERSNYFDWAMASSSLFVFV